MQKPLMQRSGAPAIGGVMLAAEIVVTSVLGEALFSISINASFTRYWAKLGDAAAHVIEPARDGAEAFAFTMLAFGFFLVPWASILYGVAYLFPTRWFEYGRWSRLPEEWFRKNQSVSRRRATVFVVAGIAAFAVGFPLFFTLNDVPGLNILLLVPFLALAIVLLRSVTRRARLALAVLFLALVVLVPPMVARLTSPELHPSGEHSGLGGFFFEPSSLAVGHVRTEGRERPVVLLGSTILGDLVVYDACARPELAEVVARDDIVVPTELAPCR